MLDSEIYLSQTFCVMSFLMLTAAIMMIINSPSYILGVKQQIGSRISIVGVERNSTQCIQTYYGDLLNVTRSVGCPAGTMGLALSTG